MWLQKALVNVSLRHISLMFIGVIITWLAIIFVNNIKIILPLPESNVLTTYCLQYCSFETVSVPAGNSTSVN